MKDSNVILAMEKNVSFSVSTKILAATALGAGVLLGASTAYILTRIHDHSNLAHLVSHLHETIREVKEEISHIENELGLQNRDVQALEKPEKREKRRRFWRKKAVSFSSSATTSSYKTTLDRLSDKTPCVAAKDNLTDSDSGRSHHTCDTEYLSPEENEDDEYFDFMPSDDDSDLGEFSPYETSLVSDDGISGDVCELKKIIRKVDCLVLKGPEAQIQAYNLLMEKGSKYDNNAEILWRKAMLTKCMGAIEEVKGNVEGKKEYIIEGYEYAEKALEINDKNAECHKWFAILAGARGEFLSMKERIANGHIFKEHIDIALQYSPNDSTLHHLLGRFCYEVSSLTWIEKKLATALYGEIPCSSYEEALEHFIIADELKQVNWKENKFYVAKCYFKIFNCEKGKCWLQLALEAPTVNADDELINKEIMEMMKEFSVSD